MTWLELFASALLGGVSATLLGASLQHQRGYRRAVLLIHAELVRNVTIFDALTQSESAHPDRWKGWFTQTAWREHSPDVAARWAKRHGDLWAKFVAIYAGLDWAPAEGRALTAAERGRLSEIQLLLRPLVPVWKIRLARRLWTRDRHGARFFARLVVFPRRVAPNGDIVGRGVADRTATESRDTLVTPEASSAPPD